MSYVQVKVYCPHCHSGKVKKNGIKATGKQSFYCHCCGKQCQIGKPNDSTCKKLMKKLAHLTIEIMVIYSKKMLY
ncbi:MAG: transposase-like zinc-binding domain-containing protein [Flammeovirgaceae bacterium]